MCQDFKGKGIKGVTLMQLTTSREPWNEGYHLKHTDAWELLCRCVLLSAFAALVGIRDGGDKRRKAEWTWVRVLGRITHFLLLFRSLVSYGK